MEPEHRAATIGKRLSKYERRTDAVPHVLTDRDTAIIAAVAEYRLLSRSQVQRLFGFGAATRVNFRLQKLFHHGYLQRNYLPTVHGSSQAIYRLDRAGVPVAAVRLGTAIETFWHPKRPLKPFFLAHQLAVNEIRMAFALAARTHTDHQMSEWRSEDLVRDSFFTGTDWQTLTPDGFGRYRAGERALSFFVEADQGTMTSRRFQDKVTRYLAYASTGRFTEKYQHRYFRVLVVTSSEVRLANLRRATKALTGEILWFSTLEHIRTSGPFGAVWQSAAMDGKQSLLTADRYDVRK